MRAIAVALGIAGTFGGVLSIEFMLSGWLGLVPYGLIGSGVLLIAAAVAGLISRLPLDRP